MKRYTRLLAIVTAVMMLGVLSACAGQSTAEPTAAAETAMASTAAPTDPPFTGFIEEDGVRYYCLDGELQRNTVVGDDDSGYFYTDDNGAVDNGCCSGVTFGDTDWIVIEGEAFRVLTESDQCLFKAAKDVAACTESGMTREEKLKACFDYIRKTYKEGARRSPAYPYTKDDWPIVCANDIFIYGQGDCFSFGSAFAYMARAIGYTESYACNSGGHGWAEVDNKTYDPEWSMNSSNYSYYGMRYDEECDVPYAAAIASNTEQKRRQIPLN